MAFPPLTTPLNETDLRTPGFLDKLHGFIEYAASVHSGLELETWYHGIQQAIQTSPTANQLQAVLKKELAQMQYLSSVQLSEDEVPEIFTHSLAQGIQIQAEDYDPWVMIRKRLGTIPHWLRNDYKSRWLKDLHQNSELLTSTPIVSAGAQVSGTVMNWLKDYDLAMGTLAPADALKKTNYLFKGANVLKTSEAERVYVQHLIEIYEKLKQDSLNPDTMDESPLLLAEDDRFKRIIDGVMYDLESGLPEAEYRSKFGVPKARPVPVPTPTPTVVAARPAKAIKSVPAPTPKPVKRVTSKPAVNSVPVTSNRVAPVAKTVDINMQALPSTVITRPSPAAASPKQTPIETSSLPTGPAKPQPGELVFSDEDEKEVSNIKRAQKVFFKAPVGIDYDYVAKRVMGIHKLFFPSYDLERRFVNLVTSYVKGVRGQLEFKDLMTRPENTGGLNLSGDTTDKILLTIGEEAQAAPLAKARKLKTVSNSPLTPSLDQMKKASAKTQSAESTISVTGEMQAVVAQPIAPARANRAVTPARSIQPSAVRAPLDARKPMMTDIKAPPKTMGPIDELANLSMQEFRRLGSTPQAATEKIKSKIDLLEAESLLKKAEGIRAWQNSPVNQLYLSLGQEALTAGRAVEEVLQQKQLTQKLSLTAQEFDAVADLNRRLRY